MGTIFRAFLALASGGGALFGADVAGPVSAARNSSCNCNCSASSSPPRSVPPVSFLQSGDTELDLPATDCFILVDWSASLSCSISPRTEG